MPLTLVFTLLLVACGGRIDIPDDAQLGRTGVFQVSDGFVSAFLFEHADGVALIDAGGSADGEAIIEALERRGKTAADVDTVFMTHGHTDHTKGLPAFPQATVYAHADEVSLIEMGEDGDEPTGFTVGETVAEGAPLSVGGQTVEVFHVPGHTAGSVVFLINGALIMGDVLQGNEDGSVQGPPSFFSDDPDKSDASVRELADRLAPRAEEVLWLGFSHSGALEGFGALKGF